MESRDTILSVYLQKYIIKIICEHYIDSVNRQFTTLSAPRKIALQREQVENQVRKDIESFSLVNKCWFNSFSQYLSVSVDFITYHYNFKDDTERMNQTTYDMSNISTHFIIKRLNSQTTTTSNSRLLKDENIKELVLNIHDWNVGKRYNYNDKSPHTEFIVNQLNQAIKSRFINLEKLIILSSSNWYKYFQFIEFNNIKISSYSTGPELKVQSTNIKEIESLDIYIDSNTDNCKDLECLQFLKSLNNVGSLYSDNYVNFKYLFDNGVGNCFKYTYTIFMENLKIQNLVYLLYLAPNVTEYNIQLCFDNLIYQLSDNDGHGGHGSQQQCKCSIDNQNSVVNFKQHWQQISESIINHKNLKKLIISHNCSNSLTQDDIENEFYESVMVNDSLSIQLIDQLKFILSNNKSITEFYLDNVPDYSSKNNVLNNFKK